MKRIDLGDGWTKLYLSPKQGVPMMDAWLEILASRGFALPTKLVKDREGNPQHVLQALDRHTSRPSYVDESGKVHNRCIGCGGIIVGEILDDGYRKGYALKVFEGTDQIRIGGWIQIPTEAHKWQDKEITRYWKSIPVTMTGLGCKECRQAFQDAVRAANAENEIRQMYGTYLAKIKVAAEPAPEPIQNIKKAMQERCLHGMAKMFCAACNRKPKAPAGKSVLPEAVTPFLDVFDRSIDTPIIE